MIYSTDTNVLLRAGDSRNSMFAMINAAIDKLRGEGHELRILPQNCIEFWNVATRPLKNNGFELSPTVADQLLRRTEKAFELIPDDHRIYIEWRRLVLQFNVSGIQVHDARIVAAMKVHGISHILTFNARDFIRYAPLGIVAVDPAAV